MKIMWNILKRYINGILYYNNICHQNFLCGTGFEWCAHSSQTPLVKDKIIETRFSEQSQSTVLQKWNNPNPGGTKSPNLNTNQRSWTARMWIRKFSVHRHALTTSLQFFPHSSYRVIINHIRWRQTSNIFDEIGINIRAGFIWLNNLSCSEVRERKNSEKIHINTSLKLANKDPDILHQVRIQISKLQSCTIW